MRGNAFLCLTVSGKGVARLDNETGGHRVQRIPAGERRGRTHSSTVTVAVLDQRTPDALAPLRQRHRQDFAIAFFSGTGPGGQNRNKVQASARITHLPTGLVRTAQTRSRQASERAAMQALHQELDRLEGQVTERAMQAVRSRQVGSGERGDKRRTYRFQDNRVLDHVTGKSTRTRLAMNGGLDALWPE